MSVTEEKVPPEHKLKWLRYHEVFLLLCIFWILLAVIMRTTICAALAALMVLAFYSDVRRPYSVLNLPPSASLRRPWSTHLCLLLSAHQPLNFIVNAGASALCVLALASVFGTSGLLFFLLLPIAVLTGYFHLTRGAFAVAKWLAVGSTRIIVFRRFSPETAARHRTAVLPIIGAYGYTVLFSDETLEKADAGPLWETQDLLGGVFYHMPHGEPDWEKRVLLELGRADFAVFDWEAKPTSAMKSELVLAARALPADRLMWILPDSQRDGILPIVRAGIEDSKKEPHFLSRDVSYWSLARAVRQSIAGCDLVLRRPTGSTTVGGV